MKTCSTCKTPKPTSEFGKHKARKDGLNSQCKECNRKTSLAYYHSIPKEKRVRERKENYNSDRKRDRHYRDRYGITLLEVVAIAEAQEYRCPICNKECKFLAGNKDDAYVIDHCHSTKKVRGLICATCNRGLGLFYDNPDMLVSAAAYLRR